MPACQNAHTPTCHLQVGLFCRLSESCLQCALGHSVMDRLNDFGNTRVVANVRNGASGAIKRTTNLVLQSGTVGTDVPWQRGVSISGAVYTARSDPIPLADDFAVGDAIEFSGIAPASAVCAWLEPPAPPHVPPSSPRPPLSPTPSPSPSPSALAASAVELPPTLSPAPPLSSTNQLPPILPSALPLPSVPRPPPNAPRGAPLPPLTLAVSFVVGVSTDDLQAVTPQSLAQATLAVTQQATSAGSEVDISLEVSERLDVSVSSGTLDMSSEVRACHP